MDVRDEALGVTPVPTPFFSPLVSGGWSKGVTLWAIETCAKVQKGFHTKYLTKNTKRNLDFL
jgi:hypothetical protein